MFREILLKLLHRYGRMKEGAELTVHWISERRQGKVAVQTHSGVTDAHELERVGSRSESRIHLMSVYRIVKEIAALEDLCSCNNREKEHDCGCNYMFCFHRISSLFVSFVFVLFRALILLWKEKSAQVHSYSLRNTGIKDRLQR